MTGWQQLWIELQFCCSMIDLPFIRNSEPELEKKGYMWWNGHTLRLCSLQLDGRGFLGQMLPMDTMCSPVLDIVVDCGIFHLEKQVARCRDSPSWHWCQEERKSDNFIRIKSVDKGREESKGVRRQFPSDYEKIGKQIKYLILSIASCLNSWNELWPNSFVMCVWSRLLAAISSGNRHKRCAVNTAPLQDLGSLFPLVQPSGTHLL